MKKIELSGELSWTEGEHPLECEFVYLDGWDIAHTIVKAIGEKPGWRRNCKITIELEEE